MVIKTKNEIRQEELKKVLEKETSPPAINVLVAMLDENKLAVKNEREKYLKIISIIVKNEREEVLKELLSDKEVYEVISTPLHPFKDWNILRRILKIFKEEGITLKKLERGK